MTETHAQVYLRMFSKGRWRMARKTRPCQHYWETRCLGDGQIKAGDRYFDTQELDGSAGGFGTYSCCAACASAREGQ